MGELTRCADWYRRHGPPTPSDATLRMAKIMGCRWEPRASPNPGIGTAPNQETPRNV